MLLSWMPMCLLELEKCSRCLAQLEHLAKSNNTSLTYSLFLNCRNFIFRRSGGGISPAPEIVNSASLYLGRAWIQFATRVRLARNTKRCQISIPRRHCRISLTSEISNFGILNSTEELFEDARPQDNSAIKSLIVIENDGTFPKSLDNGACAPGDRRIIRAILSVQKHRWNR